MDQRFRAPAELRHGDPPDSRRLSLAGHAGGPRPFRRRALHRLRHPQHARDERRLGPGPARVARRHALDRHGDGPRPIQERRVPAAAGRRTRERHRDRSARKARRQRLDRLEPRHHARGRFGDADVFHGRRPDRRARERPGGRRRGLPLGRRPMGRGPIRKRQRPLPALDGPRRVSGRRADVSAGHRYGGLLGRHGTRPRARRRRRHPSLRRRGRTHPPVRPGPRPRSPRQPLGRDRRGPLPLPRRTVRALRGIRGALVQPHPLASRRSRRQPLGRDLRRRSRSVSRAAHRRPTPRARGSRTARSGPSSRTAAASSGRAPPKASSTASLPAATVSNRWFRWARPSWRSRKTRAEACGSERAAPASRTSRARACADTRRPTACRETGSRPSSWTGVAPSGRARWDPA